MRRARNRPNPRRAGSALILSLIFIVMFAALATAMAAMSGANVQIARNQRRLDNTRACAESGLEVIRYWMSSVAFSGTTAPSERFNMLAITLQNNLTNAGVANVFPVQNGPTMTISNVPLGLNTGGSFSAVLTSLDPNTVEVDVTGYYDDISRTLRSRHNFTTRAHSAFDYGLASKGPMHLSGNIDIAGYTDANLQVEANAFIVSPSSTIALTMEGRSMIGGSVTLTDTTKIVDIVGTKAGIGGVTGAAALEHVEYGDGSVEFPEMHPELFYSYATNVLSTASPSGGTWDNVRIPAGLNPTFSGGASLRGVIYVESPNVVTFGGGTTITGVIVTDGDPTYDPPPDDPTAPRLVFGANVNSYSTGQLPNEPQFAGLQTQTGTFILAPGFRVEFTGTFGVLSGAIGANGIKVGGGTDGTVNGSLINYSNNTMRLSGNGSLRFNRSGLTKVPAGFIPETILSYDPSSYLEVL